MNSTNNQGYEQNPDFDTVYAKYDYLSFSFDDFDLENYLTGAVDYLLNKLGDYAQEYLTMEYENVFNGSKPDSYSKMQDLLFKARKTSKIIMNSLNLLDCSNNTHFSYNDNDNLW
jgi:hypothetical protein